MIGARAFSERAVLLEVVGAMERLALDRHRKLINTIQQEKYLHLPVLDEPAHLFALPAMVD